MCLRAAALFAQPAFEGGPARKSTSGATFLHPFHTVVAARCRKRVVHGLNLRGPDRGRSNGHAPASRIAERCVFAALSDAFVLGYGFFEHFFSYSIKD